MQPSKKGAIRTGEDLTIRNVYKRDEGQPLVEKQANLAPPPPPGPSMVSSIWSYLPSLPQQFVHKEKKMKEVESITANAIAEIEKKLDLTIKEKDKARDDLKLCLIQQNEYKKQLQSLFQKKYERPDSVEHIDLQFCLLDSKDAKERFEAANKTFISKEASVKSIKNTLKALKTDQNSEMEVLTLVSNLQKKLNSLGGTYDMHKVQNALDAEQFLIDKDDARIEMGQVGAGAFDRIGEDGGEADGSILNDIDDELQKMEKAYLKSRKAIEKPLPSEAVVESLPIIWSQKATVKTNNDDDNNNNISPPPPEPLLAQPQRTRLEEEALL